MPALLQSKGKQLEHYQEEGPEVHVIVSLVFAVYMFVMVFQPFHLIAAVFKNED
jgi:hypothetical protein